MREKRRKFWGWGYEEESLSEAFLAHFSGMIQSALGIDELHKITPPRVADLKLRAPRFPLPDELAAVCTAETFERAGHTYGKSYRDIVRGIKGQFDNPPDYVAYPRDEADILALMQFCERENVALIPYGGGTSVVGGVEPTRSGRYRGVITADLKHFDAILEVDTTSRAARIQAGIRGPDLEAGLKPHGFTLRHFPQSFEFSTLGGWIATRSGGHFATLYTHIDEFVSSVRLVTPRGVVDTRRLPGSGAGPSPERLFLGSEGVLGIITEAWLRLQTIPVYRASVTVSFDDEAQGIEAVRELSQSGLFPAQCRLISALEALSMGVGDGSQTILLLGFESHDHPVGSWLSRALDICGEHNGRWKNDQVFLHNVNARERDSGSARWKDVFLQLPYLRDHAVAWGVILETFETAVTWDQFEALHQAVLAAAQSALRKQCDGKGVLMWRFTHVYPDGPAPYYTVIARAEDGREVAQWDGIKAAVSEAIIRYGGTITHHHAVGKDHRRWYAQERPPLFGKILAGAKRSVDPHWILNPGVLLSPEEDPHERAHLDE